MSESEIAWLRERLAGHSPHITKVIVGGDMIIAACGGLRWPLQGMAIDPGKDYCIDFERGTIACYEEVFGKGEDEDA